MNVLLCNPSRPQPQVSDLQELLYSQGNPIICWQLNENRSTKTPSCVRPYLSCLSCQTDLQNPGLKSWWGFLAPERSKLSWKSRHIWQPSRCTEVLSSMFSGWQTICQSQLGKCYQRLIFSLHFGILVLGFKQTVDKKKRGRILSYSFLKHAAYL